MVNVKDTTSGLVPLHQYPVGSKMMTAVSARWLYAELGIKKDFTDWLHQHTSKDDWRKDNDYSVFPLEGENLQGGRPGIDAALSIQMAEHISMMTRTAKGREVREYFRQARDDRDAAPLKIPQLHNPMSQVMIDMVVRVDTLEYEVEEGKRARQELQAGMVRAETKADMAIEEMHRLTLEEFILENGLLRQFPETQWPSYVKWLKDFCLGMGMDVRKAPVYGKRWDGENTYPIKALTAWRYYELHKPRQITLVQDMVSV